MIIYLIKSILCSAILFSVYHFLLRKEKMYQFNRFYLLGAVILSLVIPALTIHFQLSEKILIPETAITYSERQVSTLLPAEVSSANEESLLPKVAVILYILISAVLLGRFTKNLLLILLKTVNKKTLIMNGCTLVILDQKVIPHTFLHYIFMNAEDTTNTHVITHELTHARQKHSLDILLIELIQCVLWFNPVLILYKSATRINHEFIADQVVIEAGFSTSEYQQLLITKANEPFQPSLASSFSYSTTKKRFMMMTAIKNRKRSIMKMIMVSLIIPALALVFSEKTYSQSGNSESSSMKQDTIATPAMVTEFETLTNKYVVTSKKADQKYLAVNVIKMTVDDRKRMQKIYGAMTEEQKSKYPKDIIFIVMPSPTPAKKSPTVEELHDWADPKIYGIWLDGNRISNAELKKYKPSDIALTSESRLLKNAAHYGQYKFQVDLMTHAYYDKTYPPKSN
jgi:bla regulator protein blaR1